ncbi:hypothetical protein BN2475_720063 [Paraburkholderia ribeironis]|uniref:Uncharacterized protein n=1 Tax=Paraburkholderia ribeironis TaxID=1247936 RepID=A0A1N7SIX2_9BURK|nr:hypothetical protein BN2475_720063 [Paraburkholderia ribeironis]
MLCATCHARAGAHASTVRARGVLTDEVDLRGWIFAVDLRLKLQASGHSIFGTSARQAAP